MFLKDVCFLHIVYHQCSIFHIFVFYPSESSILSVIFFIRYLSVSRGFTYLSEVDYVEPLLDAWKNVRVYHIFVPSFVGFNFFTCVVLFHPNES